MSARPIGQTDGTSVTQVTLIRKRDGRIVPFEPAKIEPGDF